MIRKLFKLTLFALVAGAVCTVIASRDEIARYRRITEMI